MSNSGLVEQHAPYDRAISDGREGYYPLRPAEANGVSAHWLLAGAAVVALGYAAWRQFGPDLQRYMKMRSM